MSSPLADRVRPDDFSKIVGQEHLVGKNGILKRIVEEDIFKSIIFFGPPGTGKTTIARIIAKMSSSRFVPLNAVLTGVKELKTLIFEAKQIKKLDGRGTIIFIDEIHRFNKAQQDALLPFLEDGSIRFIGATTNNPLFYINSALRSRTIILELKSLDKSEIKKNIIKILKNDDGYSDEYELSDSLLEKISDGANGDMRSALNMLEIIVSTSRKKKISEEDLPEGLVLKSLRHDRDGDDHYNVVSAFIKSMRGSDLDATVYWLARMIEAGEDPRFIARRIVIAASEDVGLADPRALSVATDALRAVENIGMPESRIILSMAAIYVAAAPKSNSAYLAIDKALDLLKNGEFQEVPDTLCNLKKDEYLYPHNYKNGYIEQNYLRKKLNIIQLKPIGYERKLLEYLERLKKKNGSSDR